MWFRQGLFVAILRKNGWVTPPRNMRGSINEQFQIAMPISRMGHTLGINPLGPMATLYIAHGTLSVGTLEMQRDQITSRKGRAWCEDTKLTNIPDDKPVGPSGSLPPASHSGEGPVIEAVGIPEERTQQKQVEGVGQRADFPPATLSYCSSRGNNLGGCHEGFSGAPCPWGLMEGGTCVNVVWWKKQAWSAHRLGVPRI